MKRSRGFSVLEVMLALIVVSIGISVLLTFSASNHTATKSKSTGNDYSIVTNEILGQFIGEVDACTDSECPILLASNTSKPVSNWSAYDYLCENTSPTSENPSDTDCTNGKISAKQYTALKTAGVDLYNTKVTITTEKSDQ